MWEVSLKSEEVSVLIDSTIEWDREFEIRALVPGDRALVRGHGGKARESAARHVKWIESA